MRRDAEYYRALFTRKWVVSVRFPMAASAVYAARFGACDTEDIAEREWLLIAADLKKTYGNFLTADQVLREMESPRAPDR